MQEMEEHVHSIGLKARKEGIVTQRHMWEDNIKVGKTYGSSVISKVRKLTSLSGVAMSDPILSDIIICYDRKQL
jgi:hypothetical protein